MDVEDTTFCLQKIKGRKHVRLRSSLDWEAEDKVSTATFAPPPPFSFFGPHATITGPHKACPSANHSLLSVGSNGPFPQAENTLSLTQCLAWEKMLRDSFMTT